MAVPQSFHTVCKEREEAGTSTLLTLGLSASLDTFFDSSVPVQSRESLHVPEFMCVDLFRACSLPTEQGSCAGRRDSGDGTRRSGPS